MLRCWITTLLVLISLKSNAQWTNESIEFNNKLIGTIEREQTPIFYSDQDAITFTGRALIEYWGLQTPLKEFVDKYMPDFVVDNAGSIIAVNQVFIQRRVSYTWRF